METTTVPQKAAQKPAAKKKGFKVTFILGKDKSYSRNNPGIAITDKGCATISKSVANQMLSGAELNNGASFAFLAAEDENGIERTFLCKTHLGYKFLKGVNGQSFTCNNRKFARLSGTYTVAAEKTQITKDFSGYEMFVVR